MRKTSRSFLKVGSILGFIFGAILLILGLALMVIGKIELSADLIEAFKNIIIDYYKGSVEKFQTGMFAYGIFLFVAGGCNIAGAVLCAIGRSKPKKGLFITIIVLSAIGGNVFAALGAIFGLVANAQEKRAQQAAPQFVPQPEPVPQQEPAPQPEAEPEQPKEEQAQ